MKNKPLYNRTYARKLDAKNELAEFRSRFHIPEGKVYMDGNSLGLLSIDAERSLLRVLDEWRTLGIGGWMNAEIPWFRFSEEMGARAASMFGALKEEVVFTGTTTVNIHTLAGSFYRPSGSRKKILADEINFPSDLYALQGLLRNRGIDPGENLIMVKANEHGLLDEDEIIGRMSDKVALVFLPSVLYRSGQLLDIARIAGAARERNIPAGFDCSHSAGVIPHRFDEWGVDFALWCSYKYMNAGPGAAAFLYVNKRHFGLDPSLPGWFGSDKEKQFDMLTKFTPAAGAGRWQISSPGILGSSPLEGALNITLEAGIETIRQVSLRLTGYLDGLIRETIMPFHPECRIITPREPERRGGHIAIEHPRASDLYYRLTESGIITDLRPPNIIRIAPAPLYNSFEEVYLTVERLGEILESL
ncbi:MAG: kynureninase [Marinilabiliales bacterium]|nr:MAG: kynureninase [Marinilabiliales bacterium]